MKHKKKIALGAGFGGLAAVAIGTFSFFTSKDSAGNSGTMGSVQVLEHYYRSLHSILTEHKTDIEGVDFEIIRPDADGNYPDDLFTVKDDEKPDDNKPDDENTGDPENPGGEQNPDDKKDPENPDEKDPSSPENPGDEQNPDGETKPGDEQDPDDKKDPDKPAEDEKPDDKKVDVLPTDAVYLQNRGNINPGDEYPDPDPENPDEPDEPDNPDEPENPDKPKKVITTSHALRFGLTNVGTKSIRTRNIIDIWVTADDDAHEMQIIHDRKVLSPYTGYTRQAAADNDQVGEKMFSKPYMDPRVLALYERETNEADDTSGSSFKKAAYRNIELQDKGVAKFVYETTDEDRQPFEILRYVVDGARLNGRKGFLEDRDIDPNKLSESDPEKRPSVTLTGNDSENKDDLTGFRSVDYLYYLGMKPDAGNQYMGSSVHIHVMVQAMQYHNTAGQTENWEDDGDWTTVFDKTLHTGSYEKNVHYTSDDDISAQIKERWEGLKDKEADKPEDPDSPSQGDENGDQPVVNPDDNSDETQTPNTDETTED